MTALRQSAIKELEKIPEDKVGFILQIMQGINGLYDDNQLEKQRAYEKLEQLRKKEGTDQICSCQTAPKN